MDHKTDREKPVALCAICGGIAAYKAVDVISQLHKQGMDVHVVMSEAACTFVQPLTFQAITGRKVITTLFPDPEANEREDIYPHLYPATEADCCVVLPATADIIAKMASGYGDELVAACALALPESCLRFFCPAMNSSMWAQPIIQTQTSVLEANGWHRIGPASGALACGTEGEGRMSEPADIAAQVIAAFDARDQMKGRRVLILSGPTHEHLDPVRYIGNPSSGKMGRALAEEALRQGAEVDFITGPVSDCEKPVGQHIKVYPVVSAQEMLEAAQRLFDRADLILFPAAVADFSPGNPAQTKQPKGADTITLTLHPTPDIAATLCQTKRSEQVAFGFALQDEDAEEHARKKLIAKNLDGIILNALDAMGSQLGTYHFLSDELTDAAFEPWGQLTKKECARRIINEAAEALDKASP